MGLGLDVQVLVEMVSVVLREEVSVMVDGLA